MALVSGEASNPDERSGFLRSIIISSIIITTATTTTTITTTTTTTTNNNNNSSSSSTRTVGLPEVPQRPRNQGKLDRYLHTYSYVWRRRVLDKWRQTSGSPWNQAGDPREWAPPMRERSASDQRAWATHAWKSNLDVVKPTYRLARTGI